MTTDNTPTNGLQCVNIKATTLVNASEKGPFFSTIFSQPFKGQPGALYRFVLLPELVLIHPHALKDSPHSQCREFVSPAVQDPLGMRVADLLVKQRMPSVKERLSWRERYPYSPNQSPHTLRDLRRDD